MIFREGDLVLYWGYIARVIKWGLGGDALIEHMEFTGYSRVRLSVLADHQRIWHRRIDSLNWKPVVRVRALRKVIEA